MKCSERHEWGAAACRQIWMRTSSVGRWRSLWAPAMLIVMLDVCLPRPCSSRWCLCRKQNERVSRKELWLRPVSQCDAHSARHIHTHHTHTHAHTRTRTHIHTHTHFGSFVFVFLKLCPSMRNCGFSKNAKKICVNYFATHHNLYTYPIQTLSDLFPLNSIC